MSIHETIYRYTVATLRYFADYLSDMEVGEIRSWTPVVLRRGYKRPDVGLLQEALRRLGCDLKPDCVFGRVTRDAVKDFQGKYGLKVDGVAGPATWEFITSKLCEQSSDGEDAIPPVPLASLAVIARFEVGTRKDAYGFAEGDIGDGAGANYGVLQMNSRGSLRRFLLWAGRRDLAELYESRPKDSVVPEIREWFGTAEGIRAQNRYFREVIGRKAREDATRIGILERSDVAFEENPLFLFFADVVVNSGSLVSPYRTPEDNLGDGHDGVVGFWATYDLAAVRGLDWSRSWLDQVLSCTSMSVWAEVDGGPEGKNEAALKAIFRHVSVHTPLAAHTPVILAALYRGSCARKKYLTRSVRRRLACAGLVLDAWDERKRVDFARSYGLIPWY